MRLHRPRLLPHPTHPVARLVRSEGGGYYAAMRRSVVLIVLALLMLLPSGICACNAAEVACPDHPSASTPARTGDSHSSVASEHDAPPAGLTSTHRCPPPLPHQPTCPVITAATVSKVSPGGSPAVVAPQPTEPLYFVRVSSDIRTRPARTALLRLSSQPLYLAHCVLII